VLCALEVGPSSPVSSKNSKTTNMKKKSRALHTGCCSGIEVGIGLTLQHEISAFVLPT